MFTYHVAVRKLTGFVKFKAFKLKQKSLEVYTHTHTHTRERERERAAIAKRRPTKTSPEHPKQNWIAPC